MCLSAQRSHRFVFLSNFTVGGTRNAILNSPISRQSRNDLFYLESPILKFHVKDFFAPVLIHSSELPWIIPCVKGYRQPTNDPGSVAPEAMRLTACLSMMCLLTACPSFPLFPWSDFTHLWNLEFLAFAFLGFLSSSPRIFYGNSWWVRNDSKQAFCGVKPQKPNLEV